MNSTTQITNQNIPNFIGWAAIILTADRLGFQAYYTDVAAKILDSYKAPEVILSAYLENEAIRLNSIIGENQQTEEANKIALKFITHDWGEKG